MCLGCFSLECELDFHSPGLTAAQTPKERTGWNVRPGRLFLLVLYHSVWEYIPPYKLSQKVLGLTSRLVVKIKKWPCPRPTAVCAATSNWIFLSEIPQLSKGQNGTGELWVSPAGGCSPQQICFLEVSLDNAPSLSLVLAFLGWKGGSNGLSSSMYCCEICWPEWVH